MRLYSLKGVMVRRKRYISLFGVLIGLFVSVAFVFAEALPENKFGFGIEYLMAYLHEAPCCLVLPRPNLACSNL